MFRMLLTLRGQTADDSAEIAGAFTTHEEDRDGSGFQVRDRATDTLWEMVEGQTQFSLDDGTVTGSASFRSSRAPDQTVAGTFTICP